MPKRVEIRRHHMAPDKPTTGTLAVWDGPICIYRCVTLELPWRDNARRESCIPTGTYQMRWTKSPRFGATWEVMGVPGRSAIRVHAANYARQLLGCIAPGLTLGDIDGDGAIDATSSRVALERLEAALSTEGAGPVEVRIALG